MNQEKIGKLIKDLRKKHHLTQKEFATKFGVTYQAVSKWETGKNMPDVIILKQICDTYHVDLDAFLDGESKKREKKHPYSFLLLVSLMIVVIITICICLCPSKEEAFEFKTLSTSCKNFELTGSIAYNQKKSSIYISHITYCGEEDEKLYTNVFCTLYEETKKQKIKIDTFTAKKEKGQPLEDFLKKVEFYIEDYSKSCKHYTKDSLHLEIEAEDSKGVITTYKIPLTLENTCS